ncbi:hypothetical protein Fmac_017433 [Flemingia macrophylla]|uniref:Uncharacterized protein n=1 Tax=Flemingia macrophylla TaxID=520843 RepID=A0ABD1M2J7_9FABA
MVSTKFLDSATEPPPTKLWFLPSSVEGYYELQRRLNFFRGLFRSFVNAVIPLPPPLCI